MLQKSRPIPHFHDLTFCTFQAFTTIDSDGNKRATPEEFNAMTDEQIKTVIKAVKVSSWATLISHNALFRNSQTQLSVDGSI